MRDDEKGLVYEAGAVHLLHSSAAFDCVQHSGKTSGAEVSKNSLIARNVNNWEKNAFGKKQKFY